MEVLNGSVALFEPPNVGVSVLPIITGETGEEVGLDDKGVLNIAPDIVKHVTGFQLVFRVPVQDPPILLQRSLNRANRADKRYQNNALIDRGGDEWTMLVMLDHIVVSHENGVAWTRWRGDVPNRVDIWSISGNQIRLFQIGVVARNTEGGEVFRVLGESRGAWDLYQNGAGIVGVPTYPEAGKFSVRETILENELIKAKLAETQLPAPTGPVPEIPDLQPSPKGAIMQWWSPFAGIRGQGPCTLKDGRSSAWVCGEDYLDEPDADGIVRLPRGTVVSYKDIEKVRGDGKNTLTKLLSVRRA